ncbi:MAG TPA: hypothetical protein VM140_00670 [Burkholderiales bacterium]|nr:hypothetical protein [Burkholderiales bacterium]
MNRTFALACAAMLAVCSPGAALGFGSEEHEKIGNLGMKLAIAFVGAGAPWIEHGLAAAVELDGTPGKYERDKPEDRQQVSYGDITACIDYFLYPAMLLVSINEEMKQPLFKLSDCRGLFGLNFVQATHSNHAHFQHGALLSYRVLHDAALAAAESARETDDADLRRKEWLRALILNGMADHFLQDFLAPGHVTTKRQALSDVIATAMHDRANENKFEPTIKFKPNVEFLKQFADWICPGMRRPCELSKDLAALKAKGETEEDMGDALSALLAGETIVSKGDEFLWEANHEQRKQRLLMVLVTARSIFDVLTGSNTFSAPQWKEENDDPVVARMAYGEYQLKPAKGPGDPFDVTDMSNIIGLSAGRENMIAHGRAGRWAFTGEIVQAVSLDSRGFKGNFVPSFGVTYYAEGSVNGWGPVARFSYVWPQTEFSVGGYVRWLSYPYPEGGRDTRRFSSGVRFDTGFSSYLTLFVALGRDFATTPEGRFDKGTMGTVGLELLFPTSQLRRGIAGLTSR